MAEDESALVKMEDVQDELASVDELIDACAVETVPEGGHMSRAIVVARGVEVIRKTLDEHKDEMMALQGSKVGFITDKDKKGGYTWDVVRECLIELLLAGGYPVNNEMAIIGGGCYLQQSYYQRRVRESAKIANLEIQIGVPKVKKTGALIEVSATWQQDGEERTLEDTLPVKKNRKQGADALKGKAKRKLLKAVYERAHNSISPVPDGDVTEAEVITDAEVEDTQQVEGEIDMDALAPGDEGEADEKPQPLTAEQAEAEADQEPEEEPEPEEAPEEYEGDEKSDPDPSLDLTTLRQQCKKLDLGRNTSRACLGLARKGLITPPNMTALADYLASTDREDVLRIQYWGPRTYETVCDALRADGLLGDEPEDESEEGSAEDPAEDEDEDLKGPLVLNNGQTIHIIPVAERKKLMEGVIHVATVKDNGAPAFRIAWDGTGEVGHLECDCPEWASPKSPCRHVQKLQEAMS